MWQPHVFVVLFGLLSLYGKGANCQHGYTLNAQQSVSVASGLCVEIPCTFTVPAGSTLSTRVTGIWKTTDTPSFIAASTEASMVSEGTKGRFTLTGKVHEKTCSFSISNAQPADQGEYVFRFEDGYHKYTYSSYKLSVSVTDLPEPTISPVGEQIAGKPITLTCTAHPAPQGCKGNITWGGNFSMFIENIYNYEREDQAGKVTSISDITVTPSQREHNSPLTCTVTYSGVSTNSSITLDVQYAPRSPFISNCTSEGCRVEAIEGTSLSLLCSAESNPPANLSWAKTGQNSTDPLNSSSGRLDVSHVTTDNGGDYMCRARNKHGNSTVSITVVILYAPRGLTFNYCAVNGCFVEGNSSVKVQEGNSLYLRCDADGNPVANVSWVKQMQNGTITQISLTAQLNVTNVTAEHGGNYMCQTINRIGNTSKSISVVVIKTLTKDKIHLEGFMFGGIFVLLLAAITAVLVMRYKKKRRPPEEVEGSQRSPPNNYEVVYANIKRKTREPNMDPSPPNEGESPDKDLQYVTLDFSKLKPKSSPEPQETLYTEVKRK
uniref:Sialic acid-binding Ig-like lectin like 2 n=1 Tax=Xenopus tropicalis TaxID=8364 RepID=A0A803JTH5_XENTR